MTRTRCIPLLAFVVAAVGPATLSAQGPVPRNVAVASWNETFSPPGERWQKETPPLYVSSEYLREPMPAPLYPDPHDGNYARRGAIIGSLTTGVATAVIMGLFAKRDCEPGLCGTEFQRGALVGGGVGLAAGGVLGWIIGSEIPRPATTER